MSQINLNELWNGFEKVLCLTLKNEIDRQKSATKELCSVGLDKFQFFEGVTKENERVKSIFTNNKVITFPPCFRCGSISCNCNNNVLIPSQIACFLSYLDIFEYAINSPFNTFLVAEDDIQIKNFNPKILRNVMKNNVLKDLNFFNLDTPCLLSMGSPNPVKVYNELFWENHNLKPSNYLFGFNNAFAKLAIKEFEKFNTTSDLYIHRILAKKASSFSLSKSIATDYSWCNASISSSIHPKKNFIRKVKNINERNKELKRFEEHIKNALNTSYWISGIPIGGTKWASSIANAYGLEIGYEELKKDGISSWMYSDNPFTQTPFFKDKYSKNPYYIYSKNKILIVKPLINALGSQIIENKKNIQSYSFRRKIILEKLNFDLNKIYCSTGTAIFSIICWYLILVQNSFNQIVKIGNHEKLKNIFFDLNKSKSRKINYDLDLLFKKTNLDKNYLGKTYQKKEFSNKEINIYIKNMPEELIHYYEKFKAELTREVCDILFEDLV